MLFWIEYITGIVDLVDAISSVPFLTMKFFYSDNVHIFEYPDSRIQRCI